MNKVYIQFGLILAGSFVCLYLAFSPAVNIPYINHDSIRYFHKFYNKESESSVYPQYHYEYDLGRPVSAELEGFIYKKVNHLSDISRLRFMTILIFAFCASLLAMIAAAAGMEMVPAFCISVAVFTLPGVQEFIFVPYLSNALGLLLSLLAYVLLTNKLKLGMHFIGTFILLETSFCLYPPSTFLFFLPAALAIILCDDRQDLKKAQVFILWALAAVTYYIMLREFSYMRVKSSGHEIIFSLQQIFQFVPTFFTKGMPQVFNLWNVYYSKALGIFMMAFVSVFIIADICITKKVGWKRFSVFGAFFLLSSSIWFLFCGYQPREFIASQALGLVLCYWCGERIGHFLKVRRDVWARIWPVLFVCAGLLIANRMTSTNVLNNYSELLFVRSRIAQNVNSSTKEIHIIRLKDGSKGYNGLPSVYDNINSTVNDYEIPDLIRVALKDMGSPFELHCMITYSNAGDAISIQPDTVVIDLNDLVYISSPQQK